MQYGFSSRIYRLTDQYRGYHQTVRKASISISLQVPWPMKPPQDMLSATRTHELTLSLLSQLTVVIKQ